MELTWVLLLTTTCWISTTSSGERRELFAGEIQVILHILTGITKVCFSDVWFKFHYILADCF